MYSNSSRSLCDLVSVAAAAATLRQFKLLQQLWKSKPASLLLLAAVMLKSQKNENGSIKDFCVMILKSKSSYLHMYFHTPVCPKVSKTEMPIF